MLDSRLDFNLSDYFLATTTAEASDTATQTAKGTSQQKREAHHDANHKFPFDLTAIRSVATANIGVQRGGVTPNIFLGFKKEVAQHRITAVLIVLSPISIHAISHGIISACCNQLAVDKLQSFRGRCRLGSLKSCDNFAKENEVENSEHLHITFALLISFFSSSSSSA